jgi:hypothetical protein
MYASVTSPRNRALVPCSKLDPGYSVSYKQPRSVLNTPSQPSIATQFHVFTETKTIAITMFQLVLAALLQLSMGLLVEAAPVSAQGTAWQGPAGGGILGFVVLVLDVIAWGMYTVISKMLRSRADIDPS